MVDVDGRDVDNAGDARTAPSGPVLDGGVELQTLTSTDDESDALEPATQMSDADVDTYGSEDEKQAAPQDDVDLADVDVAGGVAVTVGKGATDGEGVAVEPSGDSDDALDAAGGVGGGDHFDDVSEIGDVEEDSEVSAGRAGGPADPAPRAMDDGFEAGGGWEPLQGSCCARRPYYAAAAAYFFNFSGRACVFPFMPVFYAQVLGLSKAHVGALRCLWPFLALVGAPAFGMLADKTGQHRLILALALILPSALNALFAFSFVQHGNLWLIVVISACSALANSPANSLMDASAVALASGMTRKAEREHRALNKTGSAPPVTDYGKLRLWGAVGWGAVAPLAGLVIDLTSMTVAFAMAVCLLIVSGIVSWRFPATPARAPKGVSILSNCSSILSVDFFLFLLIVWIMGTCAGVIANFLFLYLAELGGHATLMGLSLTFTCISEVPVFFYSGVFIKRYVSRAAEFAPHAFAADKTAVDDRYGELPALCLALVCYLVRMLVYVSLRNAWTVLLVEPLHGVTFGLAWAAATSYARNRAPDGLAATMQGIVAAVHWGMGSGGGALVGGLLWESVGSRSTFRIMAALSALGLCLALVALRRERSSRVKYSPLGTAE